MAASANIHIDIWSERFLGTQEKGREFLDLIETMDSGMWTPQRGHFEPIKGNIHRVYETQSLPR